LKVCDQCNQFDRQALTRDEKPDDVRKDVHEKLHTLLKNVSTILRCKGVHCGKSFRLGYAWHSIASKCLNCFLCVTSYGQRPLDINCVLASTYNMSLVSELPSFLFIWFALTNSEAEEQ